MSYTTFRDAITEISGKLHILLIYPDACCQAAQGFVEMRGHLRCVKVKAKYWK
jgi:hypothetical protein